MDSEDLALDRAIGIGCDGTEATPEEIAYARSELMRQGFSATDFDDYKLLRLAEVIRDDTGRIRGCSSPQCTRAAVWERVFEKTLSTRRLIADFGASMLHATNPFPAITRGQIVEFETAYRLGTSTRNGYVVAHQFGCWLHLEDFFSIPFPNGRFRYDIIGTVFPGQQPHPTFGITNEFWEFAQLAACAQNIGRTEGPRAFCCLCRLPYDVSSGKGIRSGDGDDYWRIFCSYCGTEVNPAEDDEP